MKKVPAYLFAVCFFCLATLFAQSPVADAGPYRKLCPGAGPVILGGNPTASGGVSPYIYKWTPVAPLNDSTLAKPTATVSVTTTFTVKVTGANGESKQDTVTIFVYNYTIDAGKDTTISSGQTIVLHGTASGGATSVSWLPQDGHIFNPNTFSPDVYPSSTTTFTLVVTFQGGCTLKDEVKVTVIPSGELFFFNTMTPNGDGANDYFIVGNIEKYPDNVLEIYNRYGQKVYNKMGYTNDWDGKYLNNELPAGTYFYILDTKSEKGGKYHGQITIIK